MRKLLEDIANQPRLTNKSNEELMADLLGETREEVKEVEEKETPPKKEEETPKNEDEKDSKSTQNNGAKTNNQKNNQPATEAATPPADPQSTEELKMDYMMDYALEKYPRTFKALIMIYYVLGNHLKHDNPGNEKNLLDFLGLDENNLINIFIYTFGHFNKNADEAGEIRDLIKKSNSFEELLFNEIFDLEEDETRKNIKGQINKFAERSELLEDLIGFDGEIRDSIIDSCLAIMDEEEKGVIVSHDRQIEIAKENGIKPKSKQKTLPPTIFDKERFEQITNEDPEPNPQPEPQESTQPPEPPTTESPTPPKINQTEFMMTASKETSDAFHRLRDLLDQLKSSTDNKADSDLTNKISQIEELNMLGISFLRAKFDSSIGNILNLLIEHFKLTTPEELAAKLEEVDAAFTDIY